MIEEAKKLVINMEGKGFKYIDLKFKNPSKFIKKGNETQLTMIQEILMNSPKGKILAEYTLIGISNDNGANWKFIDTGGKSKEIMIQYFPNLSKDLVIKPKMQKIIQ